MCTCKRSPTLMKKEVWSGWIEAQVVPSPSPSGRHICSPDVLLDLSTDIICGSVCSPNPVKFRPLKASTLSSGHSGYRFILKQLSLLSSLIILLNTFLGTISNPSAISSNASQQIFFTAPMYSSTPHLPSLIIIIS